MLKYLEFINKDFDMFENINESITNNDLFESIEEDRLKRKIKKYIKEYFIKNKINNIKFVLITENFLYDEKCIASEDIPYEMYFYKNKINFNNLICKLIHFDDYEVFYNKMTQKFKSLNKALKYIITLYMTYDFEIFESFNCLIENSDIKKMKEILAEFNLQDKVTIQNLTKCLFFIEGKDFKFRLEKQEPKPEMTLTKGRKEFVLYKSEGILPWTYLDEFDTAEESIKSIINYVITDDFEIFENQREIRDLFESVEEKKLADYFIPPVNSKEVENNLSKISDFFDKLFDEYKIKDLEVGYSIEGSKYGNILVIFLTYDKNNNYRFTFEKEGIWCSKNYKNAEKFDNFEDAVYYVINDYITSDFEMFESESSGDKYWGSKDQPYWHKGANPTADMIVKNQEGKILLIRRSKTARSEPGKWAIPGGFIEIKAKVGEPDKKGWKETGEEAAARELKEETGLDITKYAKQFKRIGIYEGGGRDPRDNKEAWTKSHVYYFELPKDFKVKDVKGKDDADRAKWFSFDEIDKLEIAFDHRRILNKIKKGVF